MNLLTVSWKNLWLKPLSTILSLILIVFGVGLLTVLFLFKKEFTNQFERNQAGIDMVIGAKGSPLQLILNSMFHIDAPTGNIKIEDGKFLFNPAHPLIELAVPLSVGDSYKTFRIVGTNQDIFKLYPAEFQEGKIWDKPMETVIGNEIAQTLKLKIGDTFSSSHGFNEGDLEHDDVEPFKIVGILKSHGSVIDKLILCNTESVWAVHGDHNHIENELIVLDTMSIDSSIIIVDSINFQVDTLMEVQSINPLLNNLDKEISSVLVKFKSDKKRTIPAINMPRSLNENTPLMAASPIFQLNKLLENVGSIIKSLSFLAILIGIISALSVFISLYNNLKERKYELAMMRVQGATPSQLFKMIIFESLIIGVIGAILGIMFAHLALYLISLLLDAQFHYSLNFLKIHPIEIIVFLATVLISIIAGSIPAWKAYKTDIVAVLK